jgi:hypothetical protein
VDFAGSSELEGAVAVVCRFPQKTQIELVYGISLLQEVQFFFNVNPYRPGATRYCYLTIIIVSDQASKENF